MSVWIPIFTGILAFVGAIFGHFVAFDLSATAKRREVRRAQIERFAEFVSSDQTWMNTYRNEALFGNGDTPKDASPNDKAYAIYLLYFNADLTMVMTALIVARHDYVHEIDLGHQARLQLAINSNQHISKTHPVQANVSAVLAKYSPYHKAMLNCLVAASRIVQETIPEQSKIESFIVKIRAKLEVQALVESASHPVIPRTV